jgi:site-specific DNA-methyltransferase (adenine-specific)
MDEYETHPSQKPISLLNRIIRASSDSNDLVLDLFSGTFTTSYICKVLGRKSIGIEIDEDYFKIGLRRVLDMQEYKGFSIKRERKDFQSNNEFI